MPKQAWTAIPARGLFPTFATCSETPPARIRIFHDAALRLPSNNMNATPHFAGLIKHLGPSIIRNKHHKMVPDGSSQSLCPHFRNRKIHSGFEQVEASYEY